MPELPDLQIFARNLNKTLAGKTVKKIRVLNSNKLNVAETELKKIIEGQVLKSVSREGKELYILFAKGDIMAIHLMLNGKLFYFDGENQEKYSITELLFDDGSGLVLTDFQKAATLTLNPGKKDSPDALDKKVNTDFLRQKLNKTRTTIKNFMLDQHIMRGIGNAYADEILWEAKISPLSICNKIPDEKVKILIEKIRSVLENAEKYIAKTHPDIISGEIRDFMKIHNPNKKKSPDGAAILTTTVNSRKTYYTDEQVLYK